MMSSPIHLPHCVVGVLGGGQLCRLLVMAARRMNIRTIVWTGGLEAPARGVADEVIDLPFDHPRALELFCGVATVATVEFENIPLPVLHAVAEKVPLYPSAECVAICQNRWREKEFLRSHGFPCAPFALVSSSKELAAARHLLGPGVLKTSDSGYDGHGQIRFREGDDPERIWREFDSPRGVFEKWIAFAKELSVIVVRDKEGETVCYDPAENQHRDHILEISIVPARIAPSVAESAAAMACRLAESLDYRGTMGVEFFLREDGELLVNEIAPRPHNSGHHTLDACVTSQFEQQLRAVIGLPLGSTRLLSPVAMLNLLGDLWLGNDEPPDWRAVFEDGASCLYLYGKRHAKRRRKMGHVNILGDTADEALRRASSLKARWLEDSSTTEASPPRECGAETRSG